MARPDLHRDVDKPADDLAPEIVAIVIALAKEQARRDHAAEAGARQDHGGR